MKEFLLLLSLFCFATIQVQASNCLLHCEFKKAAQAQKMASSKTSGHDCCHDKNGQNKKEEKEESNDCMGSFGGTCFHGENQVSSAIHSSSIKNEGSSQELKILETPVIEIFVLSFFQQIAPLKIPPHADRNFLRFKTQMNLYILKDQFLI